MKLTGEIEKLGLKVVSTTIAVLISTLMLQSPAGAQPKNDGTLVKTQYGPVQGLMHNGIRQFLGIPFAKPPVGDLRWANPVPPDAWTDVRPAKQYGAFCAQNKRLGDFAAASTSEDCLYLNVFAPKGNGQKRPVMVWIYGGGLFVGMSNGYDGTALAKQGNVIVVTINYRLNVFGFLVHPAVDSAGASANFGLRDQQLALQWVKDNIKSFGGDPNNVTIFGESAGGFSVLAHLISPASQGLFNKAILESGAYAYWQPSPNLTNGNYIDTLSEGENKGQAFATAIGCSDQSASCLRSASVSTILAAEATSGSNPVLDNHVLTLLPNDAISSGQFNKVPIFNGTNRNEWRWYQAFVQVLTGHVTTPEEYPGQLQAAYGDNASAVEQTYPLSNFDSPDGALGEAAGDSFMICPGWDFEVGASKYTKVFGYEFNDPHSPGTMPPVSFPLLAAHTHEIQYIFPGWKGDFKGVTYLTKAQKGLSRRMIHNWTAFAKTGKPSPNWPRFTADRQAWKSLQVSGSPTITNLTSEHNCSFWNSLRSPSI